jgi:hypothetical protein
MRTLPILVLCSSGLMGQHPRDGWKIKPLDFRSHLTHTVADAALTSDEQEQIRRSINSFSDQPVDDKDFLVGSIALARIRSDEIVVRGTKEFCGATGNCSIWIFVRKGGQLRLALATEGQVLIVQNSVSRGLHDMTIGLHDSAFVERYTAYRWNGSNYEQIDCYLTEYPIDSDRSEQPAIVGCH